MQLDTITRRASFFASAVLIALSSASAAFAAGTGTNDPVVQRCWHGNGSNSGAPGNSLADRYTPYVGCHPTANAFYSAAVAGLNANFPKDPHDVGLWEGYGWCDYGACYGATYLRYSIFALKAGGASATGRNDYCEEPQDDFFGVAYCPIERKDTTVWTCDSVSCMDWFNSLSGGQQISTTLDFSFSTAAYNCPDGRIAYSSANGPSLTPGNPPQFLGCFDLINHPLPYQEPAACFAVQNPIYPMTGVKREQVETGFSVGTLTLDLTYDTTRKFLADAGGLSSSTGFRDLPSFGSLWSSSLHRRLNIMQTGVSVDAYRGNGKFVGFSRTVLGGALSPSTGVKDTLTAITGGYLYYDDAAGALETYNSTGQLTTLADKAGSTITFTYSTGAGAAAPTAGYLLSVTDNTGRSISFAYTLPAGSPRSSDGVISTITSSDGRAITVGYDAQKNLRTLTWKDAKVRTFLYESSALPWALTGKVDENGVLINTWSYDSQGRAIEGVGALGSNRYAVSYGTPPTLIVSEWIGPSVNASVGVIHRSYEWTPGTGTQVTGPNGSTTDANVVVTNGVSQLAGQTQPSGSGCAASNNASTFDAKGNILSQDDFQGNRTCYAYGSKGRMITRVEGLANTIACSSVLPASAVLPTGARRYTTAWDPSWKAPAQTVQPGSVTTMVYHGRPDPKNGNATANCSPATALPNGDPLNLLCKRVIEKVSGAAFDNPLGTSSDTLIDNVVLLLHGEDGDGSPVFADSSSYMKTMSSVGQFPRGTTAQSKFGGGAINFGTNGAIAYGPDNALKLAGDYTVEMFVYINAQAAGSTRAIYSWGGNPYDSQPYGSVQVDANGKLTAHWQNGYFINAGDITGPVISTGVWHHVALSHTAAGHWIMHLDGVQAGQIVYNNLFNDASAYGRIAFAVNVTSPGSHGTLNGYLDEVRVTNGAVRYWGNFTPPTAAFPDPLNLNPSAPKIADANYAKDILLIHADDVDGSKTLADSSPLAKTVTLSRNAQISTTKSKFGGSSLYVPGGTDWGDRGTYIGDYSLPGDFTVEFWMNASAANSTLTPIQLGNGNDATWVDFGVNGDYITLTFKDGVNCYFNGGISALANTWVHVAFTRIGGTIYGHVNGAM